MEFFDSGNWCKLAFVALSVSFLSVSLLVNILNLLGYNAGLLSQLVRYGKLVKHQTNAFKVPKSNFKLIYMIAAFVYVPLALWQVVQVYIFHEPPSKWALELLSVCCGKNRVVAASEIHTLLATFMLSVQVCRRFHDTHFVSVFSKNADMHLSQLSLAVFFYMGAFMIILGDAPQFSNADSQYSLQNKISFVDVLAIFTFFWAWYHQLKATAILANLRKNPNGEVVTDKYKIPNGDWFKYFSSPHYVAELLMYASLWAILGFNHSWWCVFVLVLLNQGESMISSHFWYKKNFPNFPKERKLIIPYIF